MINKQQLKILVLFASICYPLLIHYLIVSEQFAYAGIYIVALIFVIALQNIIAANKMRAIILFSIGLMTALVLFFNLRLVIMLPPVLIPLAWAYIFGASLFNDNTAWITLMAQKIRREELGEKELTYTRYATQAWLIFFLLLAAESIIVGLFFDFTTWSYITNFVNYILIIGFMLVEFTIRKWLLTEITQPTFIHFMKQLIRAQRS